LKVLITGGSGFIGSHLSELLLSKGHQVCSLDDLSTGDSGNVDHLESNPDFQLVVGSVLDTDLVDKLVERCDVIYHLAAAVGVELIVSKPLESLETNIRGSESILKHAHRYRKSVLLTSTSEIYGKNTDGPLKEEDDRILGSPLKTRWSYSTAKAVDEILAHAYWKEYGLHAVIVRLFNVVGPRQTGMYGMVLPRFVRQALLNEDITVHGDGSQSRCFAHVGDVVHALYGLMESKGTSGQVYNVGATHEITILDLAKKVVSVTGSSSKIQFIPYEEAYEEGFEDMQRRVPDVGKIGETIGWKPTTSLDESIDSIVDGMRSHLAR